MKLLYGDKTFFIGAVKFFDAAKDFGFIASNNCNMPSPKYNQAVLSGGETRMTPSPLTKRYGTVLFVV